jgi:hypothetical protein
MAKTTLHIFSKTLFALSLVLGFMLLSLLFFVQSQRLPHIAEWLNEAETEAFVVFKADALPQYSTLLGHSTQELNWLGRDMAVVLTKKGVINFYEIDSRQAALNFFEDLLEENKKFEREEANTDEEILCYQDTFADCFSFHGPFLVVSSNPAAISELWKEGEPRLSSNADYQNVHQRLPYMATVFAYIDLSNSNSLLSNTVTGQAALVQSVLQIVPAMGMTLEKKDDHWYGEAFTAIDKMKIDGEAFFRHFNKYQQELIPWTSGLHAFEWGGHNLEAQVQALSTHLKTLSPSSALVFDSMLKIWTDEYLAGDPLPLLKSEYYFAWTPDSDFLFMTQLGEGQSTEAEQLKNNFVERFVYEEEVSDSSGELKSTRTPVVQNEVYYESVPYFQIMAGEKNIGNITIHKDTLVITKEKSTLLEVLDRMNGREDHRPKEDWTGIDEIFGMNLSALPDDNILRTLLTDIDQISGGTKLFDDGIFNRFILR